MSIQASDPSFRAFAEELRNWDKGLDLNKLGLENARKLVSDRYGIVLRVVERTHDWDDAYTHSIGSTGAEAQFTLGNSANKYNGGGWIDRDLTFLAAVGETVERYCGSYSHYELQKKSSYQRLIAEGFQAVDPLELQMFDERQYADPDFEFRRLTRDSVIRWVQGYDLLAGTVIYYPASLILLTRFADVDGRSIGYSTSSGLASHSTPLEAILAGAYEQAERDAFAVAWYGNLTLPCIDPYSNPELARFWRRYIEPSGVDVKLVNLSEINRVPTVAAVSVNHFTQVAPIAFGASSSAKLLDACKSAAVESLQTRNWVKANQRDTTELIGIDDDLGEKIKDFEDHITFYISTPASEKAKFFFSGKLEPLDEKYDLISSGSRFDELQMLVDISKRQGGRVLTFNLTTPDVASAGPHVYKTLIHGFQQLDCGYSRRFLGGRRLKDKPFELGHAGRPLELHQLNPWPHPFP